MMIKGEKYITEKEASLIYGLTLSFIRKNRYLGIMPYYKLRGMVLFRPSELDDWIGKNLRAIN